MTTLIKDKSVDKRADGIYTKSTGTTIFISGETALVKHQIESFPSDELWGDREGQQDPPG